MESGARHWFDDNAGDARAKEELVTHGARLGMWLQSPPYKGGVARSAGVVAHTETLLVIDHPGRAFSASTPPL